MGNGRLQKQSDPTNQINIGVIKMTTIERPDIVTDEHLEYLDGLRESGVVNMFGAGEYLDRSFNLDRGEAKTILLYWMESFEERHPVAA
jgi:hypothetical protein